MTDDKEPQELPGMELGGSCSGSGALELADSLPSTKAGSSKAASCQAGLDVEAAQQSSGLTELRVLSRLRSGAWLYGTGCYATGGRVSNKLPSGLRCSSSTSHSV